MTDPVEVEFHLSAPDEVVAYMERLADGSGWITLVPGVLSENVPPPKSSFFSLLSSGSNFAVPEGSWLPPAKESRPVQVGVRHDHGVKALDHLVERGHPLPAGWRKTMDHPKRGLVVEVPTSAAHDEVIDWLLSTAILLTTVPLLENWLAKIHTYL